MHTQLFQSLAHTLRLRCPRCGVGRLFAKLFQMRSHCPDCGLLFERAGGEITGGMAINLVATLVVALAGGIYVGVSPDIPLIPAMLSLSLLVIGFPILFYPLSRALWLLFLYLTGDNAEPD